MQLGKACAERAGGMRGFAGSLNAYQWFLQVVQLLETRVRYLFIEEWCRVRIGHKKFKYEQDRNSKYFLLVARLGVSTSWACHGSNCDVDEQTKKSRKLGKVLKIREDVILLFMFLEETGMCKGLGQN